MRGPHETTLLLSRIRSASEAAIWTLEVAYCSQTDLLGRCTASPTFKEAKMHRISAKRFADALDASSLMQSLEPTTAESKPLAFLTYCCIELNSLIDWLSALRKADEAIAPRISRAISDSASNRERKRARLTFRSLRSCSKRNVCQQHCAPFGAIYTF